MNTFTFIILCLAVYRFTRFITTDTIFNSARKRLWRRFPPETTKLGYFSTCPWCISVWLASLTYFSYTIFPQATYAVCGVFAISAVVGLLSDRY